MHQSTSNHTRSRFSPLNPQSRGIGLAIVSLFSAGHLVASPLNDNFTNATVLSGISGSLNGTNNAATKEAGEPNHAGNIGGASVWFRWVAPNSGTVTFNTTGSAFDTLLAVYTGTNVGALAQVATDDDTSANSQSAVTFAAVAGTEYHIAVDGYNFGSGAAVGAYVLTWLYPVVRETVLSTAVTNLSNFVYDSDALFGGLYNRDKLRLSSTVVSSNTSSALHLTTYVLSYRLLDTNGLAHPLYDANGVTNLDYSFNVTNSLWIGGFGVVTSTTPAALKPAARLDPYNLYTVDLRVFRLGVFTGAEATNSPAPYLEYTNLASPDASLNVIPYAFNSSWVRLFAVATAPGQTAFQASVFYGLYRYDDFGVPSPTTDNVTVYLDYELHNASNNAVIPLQASSTNFTHTIASYTAGTPKSVASAGFTDTFDLAPLNQLDSVSNGYYVLVRVSVDNGVGPLFPGNRAQTPNSELLAFNGSLRFGSVGTTISSLGVSPPLNPPSGAVIPTTLNSVSGAVTLKSDHTFSSGGPLNVNLDAAGNAVVVSGNVVLAAPSPDSDSIARVNFQRGSVTLSPSGASANVTATLPTGLGFRLNDTSGQVLSAFVPFSGVNLNATLAPASDLTFAPGVTIYAAEESKPAWLPVSQILWHVATGAFDLPPIGAGAVFVRAAAYQYLQSVSNNLVDPPTMGDKRSNDKYWLSLNGLGTSVSSVRPDASSNALLSTIFTFGPGTFHAHFPYDAPLAWSGGGIMKVTDDLVQPSSGSSLAGAASVAVPYSQACPDCGLGGTSVTMPGITITNNQFTFTSDGGLVALGTMPATDLKWGFIPSLPNFAQSAMQFTDAAFHMPGVFVRGDQNLLPAVQRPTTILYTGFGAANPGAVERPLSAGYSQGDADYAGLNFRCIADNLHAGKSTIAGTPNISWELDARSKYYIRFSGVTGIHEAVPGSFPSNLILWGYKFTFTSYGLSYLDSQNKDSVTDGSVSLPYPAQFLQAFNDMSFSCLGSPLGGDIPPGEGFKTMAYWVADFKTHSMEFETPDGCSPGDGGYLVLGIEGYASHMDKPLYGRVGFFSNGDQIPASFGLAGLDSRLKLPNLVSIEGANKTTYTFTPVQDGYYNTYSNAPPSPTAGWLNAFGKADVPFFEDLQLHLQTSCHTNGLAASNAPIDLAGGWPRAGTSNPNYGWLEPSGRTPFETNRFDWNNLGWPGSGTIDIANYRNDSSDQKFHPRAQRLWLGVVDFDYPLSWDTTLRSFKSWQEISDDLLVVHVQHQIKYMDARHAEIDFGAQYDGLPQISIANLAFNALDQNLGVSDAIVKAAAQPVEDVLSGGLDEMDQMLNTQMKQLMDGVFDKTVDPVIDKFYSQLSNDWANAWNSMPLSQRKQFVLAVQTNSLNFFVGTGPNPAVNTLTSALKNLGNGVTQASNLIGQVEGYLRDATNAIQSVIGVINTTTNGQSLGTNIVGLIGQVGGSRPVVPKLLNSLVGDLAPQFIDAVAGPALSNAVQSVEPQLQQITQTLNETDDALSQVAGTLGTAGQFTSQINDILQDASADLTNVSLQVSLSVTQYFGQLNYDIDNPFTAISAADVKHFIRQKVEDEFFASSAAAQIQTALRQRLYDVDQAMKGQIDSVFQQLNGTLRDLISQSLADVDNTINKTLGDASDAIGAGKLSGHALIDGDSLQELRIDGHFQFKVPDDMELDAFLLIKELNSDGSGSGCSSSHAPFTEVTIGATHVPLKFISSDMTADLEAKFTFDGSVPFPVNLGGQVALNGELDFEAFQLHDLAAAMAFGKYENYIALKGGVKFNGYDFSGAVFFGRTCSLDPLTLIDPDVANVLGDPPFTGAYCYAQGWLPVSELVLGVPASCLFEISAGVGAGAFYFAEGPTYGGKMFLGVSGELLCIVSIEGDITMIGVKHGDDLQFDGKGHFEADVGPCPFCISISKSVDVSYTHNSWHLE